MRPPGLGNIDPAGPSGAETLHRELKPHHRPARAGLNPALETDP